VFPVYTELPCPCSARHGAPGRWALHRVALIGAAAYKLLDTVITRYTDYWQVWARSHPDRTLVLAFPRGIAGALDWKRS